MSRELEKLLEDTEKKHDLLNFLEEELLFMLDMFTYDDTAKPSLSEPATEVERS